MSLDSEVRPFQPPASALPRTHSAALVWVAAVASTLLVGVLLSWVALLRFGDSHGAAQKLLTTEGSPLVNDPTWIIAGTAASELAVGGVLVVAWVLWRRRLSRLPSGLPSGTGLRLFLPLGRPRRDALLGAVLLALGSAPWAEAVAVAMGKLFTSEVTAGKVVVAAARSSSTAEFALALVGLALLPALVEEPLFRGLIYVAYARGSAFRAVAISSVFFGAFHLEPAHAAATMVLGAAFGLGRLYSGSILTSMTAHAVYNAAVLVTVRWASEAPDPKEATLSPGLLVSGLAVAALGFWLLRRASGGVPLDSIPRPE